MLILGGNITANAGNSAAGIGSGGNGCSCGDIKIKWGTVTASGVRGAAIGSGGYSSCGNITIDNTVDKISAVQKAEEGQPTIGAGERGTCGTITIDGKEFKESITDNPYTYEP